MIITLRDGAPIDTVKRSLTAKGLWITATEKSTDGVTQLVVGKGSTPVDLAALGAIDGVLRVFAPASAHPKVDAHGPRVVVGDKAIGGGTPVLLSGPCAVESEEQISRIAEKLGRLGVTFLRGGVFKPRTSPYAFQGHGARALPWLRKAADANGMKVVTEVMSESEVTVVTEHADMLQVGSRNMQNFALLKAVGKANRPVLLKRSMAATVDEWLLAGEYLLTHGAAGVAFCERGLRGFDDSMRNLLDIGAVALLAHVHRLPVVVDPSHGTGRRDLIMPLAKAALAAGAAGVMIETHDQPSEAESDGAQALHPDDLAELAPWLRGGVM